MTLRKRICSVKRHTIGYVNGSGHRLTVKDTVSYAKRGLIDGVIVRKLGNKEYIASAPNSSRSLLDLPEVIAE